jgi:hypothetical protein
VAGAMRKSVPGRLQLQDATMHLGGYTADEGPSRSCGTEPRPGLSSLTSHVRQLTNMAICTSDQPGHVLSFQPGCMHTSICRENSFPPNSVGFQVILLSIYIVPPAVCDGEATEATLR